ncbi:MAG TPA: hypothetical protein VIF15_02695, partial [Polyangiaceae bacterium]
MRLRRAALTLAAMAAGGLACNAILGNEPRTIFDGGDAAGDAPGDVTVGDVAAEAPADGSADVATDAPDAGAADAITDAGDAADATDAAEGATSCADASADPLNCGVCGHSCQGATCANGLCAPTVLATLTQGTSRGIVLDSSNVYFSSGSVVDVCAKSGCNSPPTMLTSTQTGDVQGMALSGTDLYLTTYVVGPDGGDLGDVEHISTFNVGGGPSSLVRTRGHAGGIVLCG